MLKESDIAWWPRVIIMERELMDWAILLPVSWHFVMSLSLLCSRDIQLNRWIYLLYSSHQLIPSNADKFYWTMTTQNNNETFFKVTCDKNNLWKCNWIAKNLIHVCGGNSFASWCLHARHRSFTTAKRSKLLLQQNHTQTNKLWENAFELMVVHITYDKMK